LIEISDCISHIHYVFGTLRTGYVPRTVGFNTMVHVVNY